jgi:pimeloyl-ACP methyl ester carboxylesterase
MSQFVLLHGAWHGGWCWDQLATMLRAKGHRVEQPTYPGLSERSHLLSSTTSLETFTADIVALFNNADLREVTLVGHSYGGIVATLVADRLAERIERLIYLDADIAVDGCSTFALMPADLVAQRLANQIEVNGVACMPCPSALALGITDVDLGRRVSARLTPHPLKSYQDKVRLEHPPGAGLPGDFIVCTDPAYGMMEKSAVLAQQIGLRSCEIATGHDAMITAPQALLQVLCNDS